MSNDFIQNLGQIFAREGQAEYLGEAVTMAEHMLQTAALAEEAGAPDSLIAAALLHDIGHFAMSNPDKKDWHRQHDSAGEAALAPYFGDTVSRPVGLHVAAKRYLCTTEADYLATLSEASLHTYEKQGQGMTRAECTDFEADPHSQLALQLRRWDDAGKRAEMVVPEFSHYAPLLARLIGLPSDSP